MILLRKERLNSEEVPGVYVSAHMSNGGRTCWVGWIAEEAIGPLLNQCPIPESYVRTAVVGLILMGAGAIKDDRAYYRRKKGAIMIRVAEGELLHAGDDE